ncbi:hypothetical protein KRX54_00420 [Actinomycetaceae bacterium TAE3-ERU4]|nr:hypothetical protein [Actinomycetaceae bacterium TAE3-ERU4]
MREYSQYKLVGVFHANGGVKGELTYLIGKIRGVAHCELCDITHGLNPFGKKEWKELEKQLPLPFQAVHLNEMPVEVSQLVSEENSPALVLVDETGENTQILLTREEISQCTGSATKFYNLIKQSLAKLL